MENLRDKSSSFAAIGIAILELAFLLLLFFVLTDPPTPVEGQMKIRLEFRIPEGVCVYRLEDKKDTFRIKVHSEGNEYSLFDVEGDAYTKKAIPNVKKLSETLANLQNKDKVELILDISDDLSYQKFISLMDTLHHLGFEDILLKDPDTTVTWKLLFGDVPFREVPFGEVPFEEEP